MKKLLTLGSVIYLTLFLLLVTLIMADKDIAIIDKVIVLTSYAVLGAFKQEIPENLEKSMGDSDGE